MRWLILVVGLSGCTGAWYATKANDPWGMQRTHDFEMCGGEGDYAKVDACMAAKGYVRASP